MNFKNLLNQINTTHTTLHNRVASAINQGLTIRNWLIGYHIAEFEQNGEDRAAYGEKLLPNLAKSLVANGINGISVTSLKLYRQFFLTYPRIGQTLSDQFQKSMMQRLVDFSSFQKTLKIALSQDQSELELGLAPELLLSRLSFSHLTHLLKIQDDLQRAFYEIECVKGNWSVRELKRQINSMLFERTGLSKNKEKLLAHIQNIAIKWEPKDVVRDPYYFEFFGLKLREMVSESTLEDMILNHLEAFILEMGNGFCFEARQKRIMIGDEYFFIDLVFYHRILKCHVLIELKIGAFTAPYAGKLNLYLNHFRKYEMEKGDNPPIGILLCTDKNDAVVKYATEGIDNEMFVSKYKIVLPSVDDLKNFLLKDKIYIEEKWKEHQEKQANS